MTKNTFKKALENRKVYIVGTKFTRNGWTHFDVYVSVNNSLRKVEEKSSPYWNEKSYDYECSGFGLSRTLEVILNIGYAMGLKFEEIRQNYISLN